MRGIDEKVCVLVNCLHPNDIGRIIATPVLARRIGIRRVAFSLIIVLMLVVTACSQVANVPALQQAEGTWPRCISGCTANDVEINSVWLDVPAGNYTLGETVTHNVSMDLYFHRQNTYCIVVVADLYEGGVLQQADWASSIIGYHGGSGNYTYPMGTVNWTYGKLFEMRNVLVMWGPNSPAGGTCGTDCSEYNAPSKCNQVATFIVTTPLVVDFEFNEVCFCNSTTFTDKTTGGVKPYTWYWDFADGDNSTTQNATHHFDAAGTYTVTLNVIDNDSPPTTASQTYNVTVNEKPTADAGSDKSISSCGGSVQIGGSSTGGTPPYTYSWTPTAGLSNPTIPNPTASAGGTYTVRVTDANGCWAEDSVVVTVSSAPTANAGPDREMCPGGSVPIGGSPTGSGGTDPYTYGWTPTAGLDNPAIANPYASPTSTTTYSVLVTDGGGCQGVDSVTVTVHDIPTCHISASPSASVCQGTTVTLTEDGGDAVSWSWSTGAHTQSAQVSSGGTYSVNITDTHGCQSSYQIAVTLYDAPTADAGIDKEICAGGSVQLSGAATGGTSPYTYDWAGPENHPNTENPTVSTAGTYTLTVTDDKGCTDTDEVTVSQYPSPTADAGADAGITAGDSVVIGANQTASGGTPPYTYSWSPSTDLNDDSIVNPTASPAVNTTYTVTVTDSKGCTDSDDVTVTVTQGCCIYGFVYRAGTMEALAGWEVILEKHTNPWVEVQNTITDANGKYGFCGLEDGEYRVSEVVQANWNQVAPLPNQHLVTLPGGASDPVLGPFLNFENEQGGPFTVGWEASPIDKLAVLAPWIALFAAIAAGMSLLVLRRRRV